MHWKAILRDSQSRLRHWFDGVVIGLIILSLITFAVETVPDLPGWLKTTLLVLEGVTVILFTLEYFTRIWLAERKLSFIFSFLGIIDLLVILPYYLGAWIDLRSLRCFRLLRLIRILKLAPYSKALRRFRQALQIVREELILFFVVAALLLYLAAVGIYYFEKEAQPEHFETVFHGLWWALVTLTTVGYGDAVPVTGGGRFFTFVLLMIGLGVLSVPAGLLASALSVVRLEEESYEKQKDEGNGD